MPNIPDLLTRALELHESGQLQAAEEIYRQILRTDERQADAWHLLGVLASQTGNAQLAIETIQRAIALRPADSVFHTNLGATFRTIQDFDRAVACYRRALELAPDDAMSHVNLGHALVEQGNLEQAAACFRRALQIHPHDADTHCHLGSALRGQGQAQQALASFQAALRINPQLVAAHVHQGDILRDQGRPDQAEACYRRGLQVQPELAELHNRLGLVWQDQGKLDDAIASYRQALELDPGDPRVCNNLGTAYEQQEDLEQAVAYYRLSAESAAHDPAVDINLGNALSDLRDLPAALASYERALERDPDSLAALCQIVFKQKQMCDWRNLAARSEKLIAGVEAGSGSVPPFTFIHLPGTTAAQHLRCARQACATRLAWTKPLRAELNFTFENRASDKIRIGYVSGDFREHVMASLFTEMFERHDRKRFEIFGYSFGVDDGSAIRARIVDACDHTVDIRATSFVQAAQRIYDDRIDILVDLTVHQRAARNEIFALRPAPIQVHYLAYPGTSGMDEMDYILVDPFVVPADQQVYFSEQLVHLPDCYQVNDSHRPIAESAGSRAAWGLPADGTVFGCFNQPYKITPQMFDVWMRILRGVESSVLWIWEANSWMRENLTREAQRRGADPARLFFAPPLPMPEHLARYAHVDLVLDTFPYTGHATTSDALWAGCPVLTLVGDTFPARVAGSLLRSVGLPELATEAVADYERLAVELGHDRRQLEDLRRRVLHAKETSPLFDCARFTRHLQRAYERMWATYQSGAEPHGFAVPGDVRTGKRHC